MTIYVIPLADGGEGQDWRTLGQDAAFTGTDPRAVLDTLVETERRVPSRDEERDFFAGYFGVLYRNVPTGRCAVCSNTTTGALCIDCAELEALIDEVIHANC